MIGNDMAKETPVGGISVSISANTSGLNKAVDEAKSKLMELRDVVVKANIEDMFKGPRAKKIVLPVDLEWSGVILFPRGKPKITIDAIIVPGGAGKNAAIVSQGVTGFNARAASQVNVPSVQERQAATTASPKGIHEAGGAVSRARGKTEAVVDTETKRGMGRPGRPPAEGAAGFAQSHPGGIPLGKGIQNIPANVMAGGAGAIEEYMRSKRMEVVSRGWFKKAFQEELKTGKLTGAQVETRQKQRQAEIDEIVSAIHQDPVVQNLLVATAEGMGSQVHREAAISRAVDIRERAKKAIMESAGMRAGGRARRRIKREAESEEEAEVIRQEEAGRASTKASQRILALQTGKARQPQNEAEELIVLAKSVIDNLKAAEDAVNKTIERSDIAKESQANRRAEEAAGRGRPKTVITQGVIPPTGKGKTAHEQHQEFLERSAAEHAAKAERETQENAKREAKQKEALAATAVTPVAARRIDTTAVLRETNLQSKIRGELLVTLGNLTDDAKKLAFGIHNSLLPAVNAVMKARMDIAMGATAKEAGAANKLSPMLRSWLQGGAMLESPEPRPRRGGGRRPGPAQFLGGLGDMGGMDIPALLEDAALGARIRLGGPMGVGRGGGVHGAGGRFVSPAQAELERKLKWHASRIGTEAARRKFGQVPFQPGEEIAHKRFGPGVVLGAQPDPRWGHLFDVEFEKGGQKRVADVGQMRLPGDLQMGRIKSNVGSAMAASGWNPSEGEIKDLIDRAQAGDAPAKRLLQMMGIPIPAAAPAAAAGGGGGTKGKGGKKPPKKPPPINPEAILQQDDPERNLQKALSAGQLEAKIGTETYSKLRVQTESEIATIRQQARGFHQIGRALIEENPVRALSVAVGQVFVNVIGQRKELKDKVEEMNDATNEATRLGIARAQSIEKIAAGEIAIRDQEKVVAAAKKDQAEGAKKELKVRKDSVEAEKANLEQITEAEKIQIERRNKLSGELKGAAVGQIAKTIGVGAVGIVGGSLLFAAAMQVAQAALQAFGPTVERVTNQLTGFEAVTGKVQNTLADQIRASGGMTSETVAARLAQAGFSEAVSESIAPQLEQRSAIIASIKAIQEQNDLLAVGANIGQQGFDRALFQATGGDPFGHFEFLGGTRSLADVLSQQLDQIRNVQVGTAPGARGLQTPVMGPDPAALQGVIDEWNSDLKAAGSAFTVKLDPESAEVAAQAFMAVGERDALFLAQDIRRLGIAPMLNGEPITTAEQAAEFVNTLGKDAFKVDPLQFAKGLETPFRRALEQTQIAGGFEREQLNIGRFLSSIAQPFVPTGQRAAFRAAEGAPLLTEEQGQTESFDEAKASIDAAHASLKAYADEGERAATELISLADNTLRARGLTSNLGEIWSEATSNVKIYGQEIADLQQAMMWKQINYQVAQYNEQIRVASRSLEDAKSFLSGRLTSEEGIVGFLEAQNRAISKQLTLLGFELQQRKINFQVAMAGFVAPGTTPEERAARIEQAKIEADFAQKQLDLQKQSFNVGQAIIDQNAIRAVTDLSNQLRLLVQGRALTISLGIDQERLAELQKFVDAELARAQQVLQEAINIRTQIIEVSNTIAVATASTIQRGVQTALNAYGITASYFNSYFEALGRAGSGYQGRVAPGGTSQRGGATEAAGYYGTVNTPTTMTFGEAGSETVAILRNPRTVMMQGGEGSGAGPTFTINVTGNTIRNEEDIDALAMAVARKVEDLMGQRASLYGLRAVR